MQRTYFPVRLAHLAPKSLAEDRLVITFWAGAIMFAITGVTQWLFDPAPNIWVPSVVALGTAGVLVGGVAALRSRWSASFTAAGDRWAVVLAVLIGANPSGAWACAATMSWNPRTPAKPSGSRR
ncbi:MAG: hypothetical protein WBG14_12125, partial [Rhodococcus sp. (in: high G+C Gram-positive bacteria)]